MFGCCGWAWAWAWEKRYRDRRVYDAWEGVPPGDEGRDGCTGFVVAALSAL